MKLDDRQIELYSRQILLRELGGVGQRRLLEARCLLVGGGAGMATAATYLAGAGVGAVELLTTPDEAGSANPDDSARSGYAPLAERAPDASIRVREWSERLDLASFDALVIGADAAPTGVLSGAPESGSGRARRGSALLSAATPASIDLVLVPAGSPGCFACTGVARDAADEVRAAQRGTGFSGAEREVALRLAGAMAALAVLRWIAALGADAEPRSFRLAPGAPTWCEVRPARRTPCPRGCPP